MIAISDRRRNDYPRDCGDSVWPCVHPVRHGPRTGPSMRVGLDVDEVLAQLHQTWLDDYNREYGDTLTVEQFNHWDIHKLVKVECGVKVFKYLTPDIYDRVIPYPKTKAAVDSLRRQGHEVFFVSTCGKEGNNADQAGAKEAWLRRYMFFSSRDQGLRSGHLIPTRDKRNAPVDVLVDDHLANVEAFRGWSVLQTRPHNAKLFTNKSRIDHLTDFVEMLWQQRTA